MGSGLGLILGLGFRLRVKGYLRSLGFRVEGSELAKSGPCRACRVHGHGLEGVDLGSFGFIGLVSFREIQG